VPFVILDTPVKTEFAGTSGLESVVGAAVDALVMYGCVCNSVISVCVDADDTDGAVVESIDSSAVAVGWLF